MVFAGARDRYIAGLTRFRGDDVASWFEQFASAIVQSARLASAYVAAVRELQNHWTLQLGLSANAPRADAAAWTLIDLLPAHPLISAPVAAAATGRGRPRIYEAIAQLVAAGVLIPVSDERRNRWWEAAGLLDLVACLDAGVLPDATRSRRATR